jgi:hypothetical protein
LCDRNKNKRALKWRKEIFLARERLKELILPLPDDDEVDVAAD